jgi:hypothetical protein
MCIRFLFRVAEPRQVAHHSADCSCGGSVADLGDQPCGALHQAPTHLLRLLPGHHPR